MSKKIFLTGATGFIGSHLMPVLKSMAYDVITDFRYFDTEKYAWVIHLAAVTTIAPDFNGRLFDSNILLADRIFKSPSRIIYASSCSAAHLTNPYAYTKRYAEYRGSLHPNAFGLRFHNVYGPGNNKGIVKYLMDKKDGDYLLVRGPETVRDYIHVDNVVDEIINYMTINPIVQSTVFDVGTGIGTQTMDLVNLYMKLSGKRFTIRAEEAGENEPASMVSNNPLHNAMTLEQGLLKTINT